MDARDVRRRGQVYVALAALVWSSAGVLQRELSVDVATQVAGRALFAILALLTFVVVSERRATMRAFAIGRAELAVVIFGAIASGTFIVAPQNPPPPHDLSLFSSATATRRPPA